jgi:hypothetical protein
MTKILEIIAIEKDEYGNTISTSESSMPFKVKAPDAAALVSNWTKSNTLKPMLDKLSGMELYNFVERTSAQGAKVNFIDVENEILAVGREDIRIGLEKIANSMKPGVPNCSKCGKKMESRGLVKKK